MQVPKNDMRFLCVSVLPNSSCVALGNQGRIGVSSNMATKALYPGSFDPITYGHLDIVKRAAQLFDELVVAVAVNPNKQSCLSVATRIGLIEDCVAPLKNVVVQQFEGLTIDYAKATSAGVLVRGLRAVSDFEFEFKMSQMNKTLDASVETVFMMAGLEYQFLSSSVVKEVARYGGSVDKAVPPMVARALTDHFASTANVCSA